MPEGPAEVAHGPMFVGFIFNVFLYGIMVAQVYLYFTTYKHDKTWMKSFVLLLLLADSANTIFDFIYLYRSVIVHFGDVDYLTRANWLFGTDPAITGIIASLVQLFFAWRVRVLTHSWPLAGVVLLGSLSGGAGAIATSFEVGRTPQFTNFRNFKGVVIMWLASESITDIIITTILKQHKTGFRESDYMVDRIIRITVQTGLVTSLVATLDLIFFLGSPTGLHLIFNFPLCKLYTNSLMSSLNSRHGWRFGSSHLAAELDSTVIASSNGTGTRGTHTSMQMRTLSMLDTAQSPPASMINLSPTRMSPISRSPTRTGSGFGFGFGSVEGNGRHKRTRSDSESHGTSMGIGGLSTQRQRHAPTRSVSAGIVSALARPTSAARQFGKKASEVFVHVESREMRDASGPGVPSSASPRGRVAGTNTGGPNLGMNLLGGASSPTLGGGSNTRGKALSVCLSVDTDSIDMKGNSSDDERELRQMGDEKDQVSMPVV